MRAVGTHYRMIEGGEVKADPSYNPEVFERERMSLRNTAFFPTQSPVSPGLGLNAPSGGGNSLARMADLFVLGKCRVRTTHYIFVLKHGELGVGEQFPVDSLRDVQRMDLFNENVWADRPHSNGM